MNFLHLKYIVEVSKAKSINKAAENLFMAQPNLSRAIKEIEDSLGIVIFSRTSKGMELTERGEEFVKHAQRILSDVESLETKFNSKQSNVLEFSISVPHASYIANAFNKLLCEIDKTKSIEFNYKETNSMGVIKNVTEKGFKLGILRCSVQYAEYFKSLLEEKDIGFKEIFEFNYLLLMSKDSRLSRLEKISLKDLVDSVEVLHGDPSVPTLSSKEAKKLDFSGLNDKNIFVYDRGSQYEILGNVKETYMWVSPVPQEMLDKYKLVQRQCEDCKKTYKDFLIYKKDYSLSELDDMFVERLLSSANHCKDLVK